MGNLVIAAASLLMGMAYTALGGLALWELLRSRRTLGVSRFGLGFALMASSCGPHHLLHAHHVLHGFDVSPTIAAASLIGVPGGLVFVLLRIEAMGGGRGDRSIAGTPGWMVVTTTLALLGAGALIGQSTMVARPDPTSVAFLANTFVAVTYVLVGYPLIRTQIRRRFESGSWSVAGLALSGVFPTCALTHLVYGLEASGDAHTAIADLWGVPASVYFLFVVHGIYGDAIVDWNQRPATGRRRVTARQPPWSDAVGRSA